jgi:metallophosphoesterase (TIGR00282 family)
MRILFVGDVFGRPGRRVASECIPRLRQQHDVYLCIANGENAAGGAGITEDVAAKLHSYGVDVITSGNHVWDKKEAMDYIGRSTHLVRPANYPPGVCGQGSTVFGGPTPVGVLNLQGRVYMQEIDCPFRVGLQEVERLRGEANVIVIDFHAEATSEKMAMGWYMDGKVSAVIGTHTHVQTSDETVLPKGTAYITDAGMTGPHDSVIGVEKEIAIERFLTQLPARFNPAAGNLTFCGVLIDIDEQSGRARSIERLRIPLRADGS